MLETLHVSNQHVKHILVHCLLDSVMYSGVIRTAALRSVHSTLVAINATSHFNNIVIQTLFVCFVLLVCG